MNSVTLATEIGVAQGANQRDPGNNDLRIPAEICNRYFFFGVET